MAHTKQWLVQSCVKVAHRSDLSFHTHTHHMEIVEARTQPKGIKFWENKN